MKCIVLAATVMVVASPALAQMNTTGEPTRGDQSVFIMGGVMGAGHELEMLNPFTAEYEDAIVLGGGYQYFFYEPFDGVRVGAEVGAVARIGETTTGEAWAGIVTKHDGVVVGDTIRLSPSVTFGGSVVTGTMGVEAQRAEGDGLPGEVLFYLSPEISVSHVDNPNTEAFWRLHHRSGAWNSFGGGGSANATMIGVRTSF
ncbi:hypothetical protein [Pelagibacterium luteolum]|uniref:Lipid A 3-O-deacylase (PagL) n=1 Tax=Pelagibacterium luteolum TaxID=440168 RepID=A0A1G7VYE8_9HYPH|nr:hypothetical protein [Pelagibacterium luteolum]SDG64469.1 hypothetical protein SAMN04487974_10573 [Pelagibacterium luteolum]